MKRARRVTVTLEVFRDERSLEGRFRVGLDEVFGFRLHARLLADAAIPLGTTPINRSGQSRSPEAAGTAPIRTMAAIAMDWPIRNPHFTHFVRQSCANPCEIDH
jgi:hypothetical protein